MGKSLLLSLALFALLFFVPWLWAPDLPWVSFGDPPATEEPGSSAVGEETKEPAESGKPGKPGKPGESETLEEPEERLDAAALIRVKRGDVIESMTLETYLQGVLRAEMPVSFHLEALKAQAVAARTYALYKMENRPVMNHPEADACDDVGCCQAYRTAEEAKEGWGVMAFRYEEKIWAAVAETDGQTVLYEGAPVLAVFHSSSAGATRDAEEVWAASVPYLQSVASPEGAEQVPHYHSTTGFTPERFRELVLAGCPGAVLGSDPSTWFTNIRQRETGAVISLQVGGVTLTGAELRTLLGLRSAAFTISFGEEEILFSTTGYGHGVGMSQYGANVMAQEGADYREILTWYYTGASVDVYPPWSGEKPVEGTA